VEYLQQCSRTPRTSAGFLSLGGELRPATQLDTEVRELALMTVGPALTESGSEFHPSFALGRRVGVSREQLENLAEFEKSPALHRSERLVIALSCEVKQNVSVSACDFPKHCANTLDTRRLMELVAERAFYNMVVRVMVPLGVRSRARPSQDQEILTEDSVILDIDRSPVRRARRPSDGASETPEVHDMARIDFVLIKGGMLGRWDPDAALSLGHTGIKGTANR